MLPQYETILADVVAQQPQLSLAIIFGSIAAGTHTPESDLDLAIDVGHAMTAEEKALLIGKLAERTGRPIDLVDLRRVGEPLLGQILRHGIRIFGTDTQWARLLVKHLFDAADFLPYRDRLLKERREAWIAK